MKLLIVQLPSPVTSFLVSLNIIFMLFPYYERPSFTPIQNNWQNYGFVNVKLYIPGQQAG
jgi:hypothetical protein